MTPSMLPSILQAANDQSASGDATLALLGLLSAGRSFEVFAERAAPAIDAATEPGGEHSPPDAPLALALGIIAFQRHLTARLARLLPEHARAVEPDAREPVPARRPPLSRGLLR